MPSPRREAERRQAHPFTGRATPADVAVRQCPGAAAGSAEPARLSALHRGACLGDRTPRLSPGRASRDREGEGVTFAANRA